MSEAPQAGFGAFVPGFDFLQNLAKAASQGGVANPSQVPNMNSWVAPTLNPEELDKRIQELKTVHFWLEQNARALTATIQAMEVQKMTLSTLSGMNVKFGEMASALAPKAPAGKPQEKTPDADKPAARTSARTGSPAGVPGVVDPVQLWSALTQQFQHIAATAMKDVARKTVASAADAPAAPAKKARATRKPRAAAKKAPGRSR